MTTEPAREPEEQPVEELVEEVVEEEEDEPIAPSFREIINGARQEVAEDADRVVGAGLNPFRKAVDEVVDRGLDLFDTLADVWAGKKRPKKGD